MLNIVKLLHWNNCSDFINVYVIFYYTFLDVNFYPVFFLVEPVGNWLMKYIHETIAYKTSYCLVAKRQEFCKAESVLRSHLIERRTVQNRQRKRRLILALPADVKVPERHTTAWFWQQTPTCNRASTWWRRSSGTRVRWRVRHFSFTKWHFG